MATTFESNITQNTIEETTREAWHWYHLLPLVGMFIFVITPTLSWQFGVPESIRHIGDISVLLMIVLLIVRMLTIDRIPGAFMIILALSIFGILVASFEGQVFLGSLWGWWTTFRYPMVGLYVYLVPNWPKSVPNKLLQIGLAVLALQVLTQAALYATGIPPGDFLSGTFGRKGTGLLIVFVMLVVALGFGHWLSKGGLKYLFSILALGAISSVLGEMKLFIIVTPLMALIAFVIHLLRRGQIRKSIFLVVFMGLALVGYFIFYNFAVSKGTGAPSLEAFLESDKFDRYLTQVRYSDDRGAYHIDRGIAGQFAWNAIQRDTATLFFGYGLGTSQISKTFGLTGAGFDSNSYGVVLGSTALMILIQEMGLVGVGVFGIFMLVTIYILFKATKQDPNPDLDILRFGTILFTIFWPVWIWYNSVWYMNGPAIIYWAIWGYIIQQSTENPFRTLNIPSNSREISKA